MTAAWCVVMILLGLWPGGSGSAQPGNPMGAQPQMERHSVSAPASVSGRLSELQAQGRALGQSA